MSATSGACAVDPAQHPVEDTTLGVAARRALEAIERAIGEPPSELTQDVDVAERAIAELRDCLIEELRRAPSDGEAQRRRRLLDEVNVALSLVAGVEYPSAGIQRSLLEEARDVLRRTHLADA